MELNSRHPTTIYENARLTAFVNRVYQHMSSFGYQNMQVPAIAPAEVFLAKAGDEIITSLFTFDRFGKQLALRPEFTALAARRYVNNRAPGDVVRWQFNGSVFLEDHTQRQRDYQRMSIGAEMFGMLNTSYADAEIMTLALGGIQQVAELDASLCVGHTGLIREILGQYQLDDRTQQFVLNGMEAFGSSADAEEGILDRYDATMTHDADEIAEMMPEEGAASSVQHNVHQMLDVMLDATQSGATMGGRQRSDIVRRLLKKRERISQRGQLRKAVQHLLAWQSHQGTPDQVEGELRGLLPETEDAQKMFTDWMASLKLGQQMGLREEDVLVKPGMIRNWNYYTGVVFEVVSPGGEKLGGGGRYDGLAKVIGASHDVPAVGFAYYIDDIMEEMDAQQQPRSSATVHLLQQSGGDASALQQWANTLREAGLSVAVFVGESTPEPDGSQTVIEMDAKKVVFAGKMYSLEQASMLIEEIRERHG